MRVESKYHLDAHAAYLLRDELLASGFALDPHCAGGRSYTVRSIYLDSLRFDAYHEKEEGVSRRAKYRLRSYAAADVREGGMNLEIKEKDASLSWKSVHPISYADVERFVAGELHAESSGVVFSFGEKEPRGYRYPEPAEKTEVDPDDIPW